MFVWDFFVRLLKLNTMTRRSPAGSKKMGVGEGTDTDQIGSLLAAMMMSTMSCSHDDGIATDILLDAENEPKRRMA